MAAPTIELLVVQPTPFCNLDCAYCYLPQRSDRRRMSEATLERVFARVFESPFVGERLTVVWHAGEPLVLPVAFYESAFDLAERMRPRGLALAHSFQTNATLLDAGWLGLLRRSDVRIGVSLDGPRHLHDARRRDRAGRGSFDRTLRGIRLLQDGGIPFHVIAVLTAESLADPDGLYDFFVAQGIRHVGFNIDEQEGVNARSSMDFAGVNAAFRRFLRRFLERVRAEPDRLAVREFAGAEGEILAPAGRPAGNEQVEPFRILSVDAEGNVSTFSPEFLGMRDEAHADFIIGNLHKESLAGMAEGLRLRRLARDIAAGVEACRDRCAYFAFCGGGAPANKLYETGRLDTGETLYCRLTKQAVLDVVLEDFETRLGLRPASAREEPPLPAEARYG